MNSITMDTPKNITDKPKHEDGIKIPTQNSIIKFHDKPLVTSGQDRNISKPTRKNPPNWYGFTDKTRCHTPERHQPWLEDTINDKNRPLHDVHGKPIFPISPVTFSENWQPDPFCSLESSLIKHMTIRRTIPLARSITRITSNSKSLIKTITTELGVN